MVVNLVWTCIPSSIFQVDHDTVTRISSGNVVLTSLLDLFSRALCESEQSPIPKKIWLPIHPRYFGRDVTICPPYVHPPTCCLSVHKETNLKMLHFLAKCGTLKSDTVHPCCGQLTVKTVYLLTSNHMTVLQAQMLTFKVMCFF